MIRILCDCNARQRLTRVLTTLFETQMDDLEINSITDEAFEVLAAIKDPKKVISLASLELTDFLNVYTTFKASGDTQIYLAYLITGLRYPIQKKLPEKLTKKICVLVVKHFVQ